MSNIVKLSYKKILRLVDDEAPIKTIAKRFGVGPGSIQRCLAAEEDIDVRKRNSVKKADNEFAEPVKGVTEEAKKTLTPSQKWERLRQNLEGTLIKYRRNEHAVEWTNGVLDMMDTIDAGHGVDA